MSYFHLAGALFASVMQTLFATLYNRKNATYRDITPLYNVINFGALSLLWGCMFLSAPTFHFGTLFYSLGFSVGFAMACIGLVNALNAGPISLTSLILQFSCIGSTIWGFFFWDTKITTLVIIGLVLVCISLVLCLYSGKQKGGNKISGKWLFYVTMCFVGNLVCMIVQKEHQMRYDGAYGNQLMLVAMLFALILSIVIYLRSDRADSRVLLKRAWFWPVLAGISNLLLNFFMMRLAISSLSPGLIYPSVAVVPLVMTTIISFFAFGEKLKWSQWIGIAVGVVAILTLSI